LCLAANLVIGLNVQAQHVSGGNVWTGQALFQKLGLGSFAGSG
jgi:hypothetical protein